jgi:NAD(P)-dependent dehydrogenase (short-subunit alcohol dehydrogenase family)
MKGKTVVVTGANQGIGKVSALELAKLGADVVLVCRNADKGRAAVEEIRVAAPSSKIDLVVADFASLSDVWRAADEIQAIHPRLDVLLNNAGLIVPTRRETVDGLEETFAVNHLAPFLLTTRLLDALRSSPSARVVTVSSTAHRGAKMNWDDLQATRRYRSFKVYGQSKLANILFTYELANRLKGSTVTANTLHPGVIASGFGQSYPGWLSAVIGLAKPFMLSNADGAKTSIFLASSPEVEDVSGKYFDKCRAVKSNEASYDVESQKRLWSISEELVAGKAKAAA